MSKKSESGSAAKEKQPADNPGYNALMQGHDGLRRPDEFVQRS